MTYLAIHHTAVARAGAAKQLQAVNRFHRDDPGRKYPASSLGWNVGYNYFIDTDGTLTHCRRVGEATMAQIGHNCTNTSDCDTISVCLAGDFNKELPSDAQIATLKAFIAEMQAKYPGIKITMHRKLQANRTCPGELFSDEYLNVRILGTSAYTPDADEAEKAAKTKEQADIASLMKLVESLRLVVALLQARLIRK